MSRLHASALVALISTSVWIPGVHGDGVGLLGAGKWLYRPTCAHSCRRFIIDSPLLCEQSSSEGSSSGSHSHSASPDTECYLENIPYLQTVALCISDHCAVDQVSVAEAETYWEAHLASGTLSDRNLEPAITYSEALRGAQEASAQRELGFLESGAELNQTMRVSEEDFTGMYNYQKSFEWGEVDHGRNSIILTVTAVAIPILVSVSALLPFRSVYRLTAFLDQPLLGHAHRAPFFGAGTMPTRAQSIFFAYLMIMNIILMCLPLRTLQPNTRLPGEARQALQIIGDRAGVLAAANFVPLVLTSARNNILLWVTNWSNTTFLLLHRWLGYIVILQTVVHSAGLLHYFLIYSDHSAEAQLPYWYWGIISTLAICLIWPLSILPVRQRAYEVFLAAHKILAALALIAYFLHIWYLFEYNWGYEIWVYVAGAIWFLDRLLRVLRIARTGVRSAQITSLGENSDLLKIEIAGVVTEGYLYLYFPTLTWRFWENHPFSVLSSFGYPSDVVTTTISTSHQSPVEKSGASAMEDSVASPPAETQIGPKTTLLLRPQNGLTRTLLDKTRVAGGRLATPVLIESSYHGQSTNALRHCSTLLAIAGGVGITAILPIVQSFRGPVARLYWGVKHDDIVNGVAAELQQLQKTVSLNIKVGERIDVTDIIREEALTSEVGGDLAIVVCGPPEMADDVRAAVGKFAGSSRRGIVFLDEAFNW